MKRFTPTVSTRGKYRILEFGQCHGPAEMGVTTGNVIDLFISNWAYEMRRVSGMIVLYQYIDDDWVYHSETSVIGVYDSVLRHVSVCFDSTGWPVITYETAGGIYVRQYNLNTSGFIFRGPFPGVDPLVSNDAEITRTIGDSDVVLWNLTVDRKSIVGRLQRDQYTQAYLYHEGTEVLYLDQVIPGQQRFQLYVAAGDEKRRYNTDLYPYITRESVGLGESIAKGTYTLQRSQFVSAHTTETELEMSLSRGTYNVVKEIFQPVTTVENLETVTGILKGSYIVIKEIFNASGEEEIQTTASIVKGMYKKVKEIYPYSLEDSMMFDTTIKGGTYREN